MSDNQTCKIEVVKFHGDSIEVIGTGDEGRINFKNLCVNIGIDFITQLRKLKGRSWAWVGQKPTHDALGRTQLTTVVDLPTMHGWLVGLNENKVKPEARDKLIAYQREAVEVLARHFNGVVTDAGGPSMPGSQSIPSDPSIAQLMAILTATAQTQAAMATTMAHVAEASHLIAERLRNMPGQTTTVNPQAEARIEEARDLAASAVHIQTGSHSSCSVMGYARLTGRHLDEAAAKAHGLKLAAKLRTEGRGDMIGKTSHQKYGGVNTYPIDDLASHFGDEAAVVDKVYAAMAN